MHPLAIVRELQAGITDEQRAEWLASDAVGWANESFAIAHKPEVATASQLAAPASTRPTTANSMKASLSGWSWSTTGLHGFGQSSAQAPFHSLSILQETDACVITRLPPDLPWKRTHTVDHQDHGGIDLESLADPNPGATRRDMKGLTFQNPAIAVQFGTPQHRLPSANSLLHVIFRRQ
jgi:hypothetical protein